MTFKRFEEDLNNDEIGNVCLLCGQEYYLARWALKALTGKYVTEGFEGFDLTLFDGKSEVPFSELLSACETLPVMSAKRVVVVEDMRDFEASYSREDKDEKEFLSYLSDVPESCLLVFICREKTDKRKKIYKKIGAAGKIYEFDRLNEADLKRWISKRFKSFNKNIDQGLVRDFIMDTGYYDKDSDYSLFNMQSDIHKIALHADGDEIKQGDIELTVSSNVQRDVFLLIDALAGNDKKLALLLLSNLMSYGESIYGVLALLFRQYENMLKISEMKDNRESAAQIRQRLGLPDFVIKKLSAHAARYDTAQLKRILHEAYEVDRNIKTGLLEPRISMEMFIAKV